MSTVPQNSLSGSFLLNRSRVAGDLLDLFLQDFRYFNDLGQRLDAPQGSTTAFGARLLRYVVDGEGSVLDDITIRQGWPIASTDNDVDARKVRWLIYDRWEGLSPEVLIRFARVLAASSPVMVRCPRLDLSKTAPWVEALARDLTGLPVSHEMFWRGKSYHPHSKASVSRLAVLMKADCLDISALFESAFTSVAGRAPDGCDFLGSLDGFGRELARRKRTLAPLFGNGGDSLKLRALSLLAMARPEERAAFTAELLSLARDSSAEVREAALPQVAAIEPFIGERMKKAVQSLASSALEFQAPKIEVSARTSTEARAFLTAWLAETNEDINPLDVSPVDGKRSRAPLSSGPLTRLAHEIESAVYTSPAEDDPDANAFKQWLWSRERRLHWGNVVLWASDPSVRPIHIARLLTFTGQMRNDSGDGWSLSHTAASVLRAVVLQCGKGSLLEFARSFEALGAPPSLFIREWYTRRGAQMTSGWPADCVWPFFASSPEALDAGFDPAASEAAPSGFDRLRLFDALASLPELSGSLQSRVIELAAAPDLPTRAAAMRLLGLIPDGVEAAVEYLTASARSEKDEAARDRLLSALTSLGEPIERHLLRQDLAVAAFVELSKRTPVALAWFPFAQLPEVRWASDQEPVSPEIVQWFIIRSHRLKNTQPGAIMRRYCQMFESSDREALGVFTLGAWMAKDLTSGGSGVSSRGLLALVASCGGAHVAAMSHQYLKEWRNLRPAQCRALLQMLAATDHPAAMQLLLTAAERFRARGLADEIGRQVTHLASRMGWTAEELNDRSIPRLGLDESGVLSIDCGGGVALAARLTERLEIEPANDAEPASDTRRKALSAVRSELRTVLCQQRDRLYEAMCGGRTWPFEDWSLFIRAHPVLRYYCRRLVWAIIQDDEITSSFRPLSGGSLTSATDDIVQPPLDARVTLLHDCTTDDAAREAWRDHFKRNELSPLFPQFGRGPLFLSGDQLDDISLDDCEGVVIDTLKLRDAAAEHGYARGPEDREGWCFSYVRRFPTLSLEAVIEFTGDQAPEHNRYVALRCLSLRSLARGEGASPVPLSEIPPVLLSECWNDLHEIAALGSSPAA